MPYYCHQVTYTKEAWARLMENPQDRLDAVRAPIEKLGGSLQLVNPAPSVREVFGILGLEAIFTIHETVDQGVKAALKVARASAPPGTWPGRGN